MKTRCEYPFSTLSGAWTDYETVCTAQLTNGSWVCRIRHLSRGGAVVSTEDVPVSVDCIHREATVARMLHRMPAEIRDVHR
jgi:hypothetical protein